MNYANILVLLTRLRQACVHPYLAQSACQQPPAAVPGEETEEGKRSEALQSAPLSKVRVGYVRNQGLCHIYAQKPAVARLSSECVWHVQHVIQN